MPDFLSGYIAAKINSRELNGIYLNINHLVK